MVNEKYFQNLLSINNIIMLIVTHVLKFGITIYDIFFDIFLLNTTYSRVHLIDVLFNIVV